MSAVIQYDLFKPLPTEVEVCRMEVAYVKDSCDKVRKKLFAEHGNIKKRCFDLEYRLEILESNICKKENLWKS